MKDLYVVDEKMARNGHTMSNKFSFFSYKIAKKLEAKESIYVIAFHLIKIFKVGHLKMTERFSVL